MVQYRQNVAGYGLYPAKKIVGEAFALGERGERYFTIINAKEWRSGENLNAVE